MASGGLVITEIQGVVVANFSSSSILDGASVEQVGKQLYALVDEKAHRKIILDFTTVKFLSSTVIGVIIALHKKAASIKGKVVICGLREDLFKVFKIMKLEKMLQFAKDEKEALMLFDVFMQS